MQRQLLKLPQTKLRNPRHGLLGSLVALALMAAVCANPTGIGGPPTAAEILKKPAAASFKDAHFTMKAHTSSGAFVIDLTGDGTFVRNPPAEQMHYQGSLGAIPLAFDTIVVGGKEYTRTGSQKWTVKDASSNSSPSDWSKATNPKLVGEDSINGAKAWHVSATASGGAGFEVWVREADGYPLKYVSQGLSSTASPSPAAGSSGGASGSLELNFDKFNTGSRIQPPPAADVKPPPQNVSAKVGDVMHLTGLDLTVVSANLDAKSPNEFITPKSGNRFVTIEVLYVLTGAGKVDYNPYDWKISDSQGFSYNSTFGVADPALNSGSLSNSGDKARGFVAFEVPAVATGLAAKVSIGDDSALVALS